MAKKRKTNKKEKKTIQEVKDQYAPNFLKKRNVVGVGVGNKVSSGKRTSDKSVMVFVSKKEKLSKLKRDDTVPNMIEDIPTDVYEIGELQAEGCGCGLPSRDNSLLRLIKGAYRQLAGKTSTSDRWRPIPGGVSISNEYVTSGTYSWKAKDLDSGRIVGYTNAHVGVSDLTKDYQYHRSRKLVQPGTYFGGKVPDDLCGEGASFVKLDNSGNNWVDGMIFYPSSEDILDDRICKIGVPSCIGTTVEDGLEVKKYGATTLLTSGSIVSTNATVKVNYGDLGSMLFLEQIVTTDMSDGGDSGSSGFINGVQGTHKDNELFGVLFAGSSSATIFNPIQHFMEPLDIVPLTKKDINGGNGGNGEDIKIYFNLEKKGKTATVFVSDKSDGMPISGAHIVLNSDANSFSGTSDAVGQLKIDGIVNGDYVGTCSKEGYITSTKPIEI